MTKKELVQSALAHREVPPVPCHLVFTPPVEVFLLGHFGIDARFAGARDELNRALGPVVAEVLHGLGALDGEKGEEFRRRYSPAPLRNARGEEVGEIRAARRAVSALLRQLRSEGGLV